MSESTETGPVWVEIFQNQHIGVNLMISIFYAIFGTIGNGLVIAIYSKQHKLTGRVYILLLAAIDLTACVFVAPQVPLYYSDLYGPGLAIFRIIHAQEVIVMLQSYIFVQSAMVLDQFLAVFYPIAHKKRRRQMNFTILATFLCVVAIFVAGSVFKHQTEVSDTIERIEQIGNVAFMLPPLTSLTTMLLVYPAIARKLYKQHRAVQPAKNKERQRKAISGKSPVTPAATEITTRAATTKETTTPVAMTTEATTLRANKTEPTPHNAATNETRSAAAVKVQSMTLAVETKEATTTAAATNERTTTTVATNESTTTAVATNESTTTAVATNESMTTAVATNEIATTAVATNETTTTAVATNEIATTAATKEETTTTATAADQETTLKLLKTRTVARHEMTITATSGATANIATQKFTPKPRNENIKQASKREMHIQALKIYGSIFVLFAFSVTIFSLVIILAREKHKSAASLFFIYFLNHVGNPVIYYALIDTFRREVNAYFRRVLQCCRKK